MTLHLHRRGAVDVAMPTGPGGYGAYVDLSGPSIAPTLAGVIFLNNTGINVPATNEPEIATKTYTLPQDVNILSSVSHMHQRATNFVATASTGETLFATEEWAEPPPKVYAPPLHLTAGTRLDWSCTYVNDTSNTLVFGESATENVMCIGVSIFYPVSDISTPVLGSLL